MMKLFRNLLKALRKRDLRHFFVRSYNLFSVDYIEDLNILEPLVEICEKINENPMQFVRKLTQRQNSEQAKKEQNCMPALTTKGQSEKSTIEDLREIEKYHIIQVADFPKMFDICWDTAYFKILISQEPNISSRILDGIKSVLEWCKYVLKQDDFAPGNEEAIIQRMLDPSSEDSFDLSHILPADSGPQFIRKLFRGEKVRPAQAPKVIQEDIPLD